MTQLKADFISTLVSARRGILRLRHRPDNSCALIQQCIPFKYRADLERFLNGLRKARLAVSINETAYRGGANVGV